MDHMQGIDRNHISMFCFESAIPGDAFVRVVDAFVDAFVDATDLKSFGFLHVDCSDEGRPPYHPSALLKLYLYGYRYGIKTSRNHMLSLTGFSNPDAKLAPTKKPPKKR